MNKYEKEEELKASLDLAKKSRYGKSYKMMLSVYNSLKKGDSVYLSTKNKGWFLARFTDLKVGEIEYIETSNPNIFKLKLK